MPSPVVAVLSVIAGPLVVPSLAQAGTVSVSGNTITFRDTAGESNFITVNWGNGAFGYCRAQVKWQGSRR